MAKKKTPEGLPPEPSPGERSAAQSRVALKRQVRYFYDLQRLRLQVGGRLAKRPEGASIDLHPYDLALLETRAKELESVEKMALADITAHLKTIPFYVKVLSDKERYRGIGPTMAGVILSEYDIYRQDTPSQMWSFTGLAPVAAFRCKHCQSVVEETEEFSGVFKHTVKSIGAECVKKTSKDSYGPHDVFASGRAMRPEKGTKLPYNAFLKTKMVGVLGPVLLKVGSPWRVFYDNYKHRKINAGWGVSDAHRHNAAIRYMVKMLILGIYEDWRSFEGLPKRPTYQESYLNHTHVIKDPPKNYVPPEDSLEDEVQAELELLKEEREQKKTGS